MNTRWLHAVILTSLLVACTPGGQPPQNSGALPGSTTGPAEVRAERQVLNIGVKGFFGNPSPQSSNSLHPIYFPLYDNLTQIAGNFEVKPSIATKWEVANDLKTWRFTIRKDVTWSDGTPLTANDVLFSLKTVQELRWPQLSYFTTVASSRVVDDATVEIVTSQPDMTIPWAANFLWIIPQKYFESVGFEGFIKKPIGSGPYEMVEFREGASVSYKKRTTPHAFRTPIATELNIQLIPENSQVINGLQTGTIDLAADITFSGEQAERLKSLGLYVLKKGNGILYLLAPQGSYESRNTPLKDKRVRNAIKYAINSEALAKTLYAGYADPINQIAVPGTLYYDEAIKPVGYDPAKAKALLAEAGYPNGFTLPGGMDYTTDMTLPDFALAVQGDLRAVGIEVPLIQSERALFVDKAYGRNNLTKGDLWSASQSDQIGFGGSRVFIGCGRPTGSPPAVLNWCNPEWDRLMDAAYAEPDTAKRATLLKQANRLQVEDANYIGILLQGNFVAASAKMRNLVPVNPTYYNFDAVYKVQ